MCLGSVGGGCVGAFSNMSKPSRGPVGRHSNMRLGSIGGGHIGALSNRSKSSRSPDGGNSRIDMDRVGISLPHMPKPSRHPVSSNSSMGLGSVGGGHIGALGDRSKPSRSPVGSNSSMGLGNVGGGHV